MNNIDILQLLAEDESPKVIAHACLDESPEGRQARHSRMTITQLAKELKAVKAELESADIYKSALQKVHDRLAKVVLPERMDEEDISTIKIEGIGRIQKKTDIYCSCPAHSREALQQWLNDNGHGSLVSTTVNASTLRAFIKEQMKAGSPIPDGLLTITPYQLVSIVKA